MKKRQMMFIPEVNPSSFVFFFERGTSGASWSIRDYSINNSVRERGARELGWSAEEVHLKAQYSFDAPTVSTEDLAFWHKHTSEYNMRYLGEMSDATSAMSPSRLSKSASPRPPDASTPCVPMLNLRRLLELPKSRKAQDMDRILHSPNSEDWVTWNFFQILTEENPSSWWGRFISVARSRNPDLDASIDDCSLPTAKFWTSVPSPSKYEAHSRSRMLESDNPEWIARANVPDPVEGSSEIDVVFEQEELLVFVEAKLGSDVSMRTTYDPGRNQIIRNIDCLIERAGERLPMFWMLARDIEPSRGYVQLMNAYKSDPSLLARDLPHRNAKTLESIARNLTIMIWSDFAELVCGIGDSEEKNAVKRELERRILAGHSGCKGISRCV